MAFVISVANLTIILRAIIIIHAGKHGIHHVVRPVKLNKLFHLINDNRQGKK
jgi:hypothetical protein